MKSARPILCGLATLTLCHVAFAQTVTYGPILGRGVTPDQMIVKWGTDSSTGTSSLSFAKKGGTLQPATGTETQNASSSFDHQTVLTGLALDSAYDYQIQAGTSTISHDLTTCPAPGAPMDLVFYGDSRNDLFSTAGQTEHAKVVAQVLTRSPDIVFESGDLVYDGMYAGYLSQFFPVVSTLAATVPFMAVPGNHDNDDPLSLDLNGTSIVSANFGLLFPMPQPAASSWTPYYAFTCGNAMFIGLDSEELIASGQDTAQLAFLTAHLAAAQADASIDHVFVWFHVSPYSPASGLFAHGDNANVISQWVPLFDDPANKVTAVFTGHDHLYGRMNDGSHVVYIVSGGAGASSSSTGGTSKATTAAAVAGFGFVAVHVAGKNVSGTAYDDSGAPVDTWSTQSVGGGSAGGGGGAGGGGSAGGAGNAGGGGAGGGNAGGSGSAGGGTGSAGGGGGAGGGGATSGGGCSAAGSRNDSQLMTLALFALAVGLRRRRSA